MLSWTYSRRNRTVQFVTEPQSSQSVLGCRCVSVICFLLSISLLRVDNSIEQRSDDCSSAFSFHSFLSSSFFFFFFCGEAFKDSLRVDRIFRRGLVRAQWTHCFELCENSLRLLCCSALLVPVLPRRLVRQPRCPRRDVDRPQPHAATLQRRQLP